MKKSRIVCLIAALLVLATCLTSCGVSSISNVSKYLNKDYDLTPDMITESSAIDDLKGYELVPDMGGDEFLYFTNTEESAVEGETAVTSHKVFGVHAGKVIVKTNDSEKFVDIDFLDASVVLKEVTVDEKALETAVTDGDVTADTSAAIVLLLTDPSRLEEFLADKVAKKYITVTYTLYDVNGNTVATADEDPEARDFGDLVLFNYKAYETDKETGGLVEKMDVPEYMELGDYYAYNDTYYYAMNDFGGVTVYDHELKVVSNWTCPEYADESMMEWSCFAILNNGDMLCQYSLILDEDTTKYDYTVVYDGLTFKVDLVTLLISAKTGKEKELDVNYVIDDFATNSDLYDDEKTKEENRYTDKFENIAWVYYIEDQKLRTDDAAKDVVLLSNKGKIQKSLKLVDNQTATLATKVGDDLYSVQTLDGGMTLVKGNGKVVHHFNNAMTIVAGTYLMSDRAIYDLELNKVYDFKEEDGELETVMDDVIFIRETTEDGYKIVALKADSTETEVVYTYVEDETKTTFDFTQFGYVVTDEAGDMTYYNANGDTILETTEALTYVIGDVEDGLVIMKSTDEEGKATYYAWTVE